MWVASFDPLNAWIEQQRQRKGEFTLCLSWDIHCLLSSDNGAPSSWTFQLRLGLRRPLELV